MINMSMRRVSVAVATVAASLATGLAAPASATATAAGSGGAVASQRAFAAPGCPVVEDKLHVAIERIDLEKVTPEPAFRQDCATLYRADGRGPEVIFEEGFKAKDTVNGQYDLESYVLKNQPSPYVSTTRDHDLFKKWAKWLKPGAFNYYIDAPNGIDVNKTIGDDHKYADQLEIAFPGGIAPEYIIGVCPIHKRTKTEIMSECESNPGYRPVQAA
ncbi:ADP-ribosyltransferase [Streptomyces sp. NPDC050418]|uniref:ADP-ribosyltransferase n=1 Tax=Streptomyces sp. NPDC050418 TaxID=3365612 RepID=UPI00379A2053